MTDASKCEHCLTGHWHSGKTVGEETTLGDLPCYVARPPASTGGDAQASAGNRCILICTDIFGWELTNVRLIADRMSQLSGLPVFVPDILQSDAMPTEFDRSKFGEWLSRHAANVTWPLVTAAVASLRELGFSKIGAQGYCFGAHYSSRLASEKLVDAHAVAHPSSVSVDHFKDIRVPGIFLCAETDQQFPAALADEVEKLLLAAGVPTEFRRYPGTTHGFAVRGSDSDPVVVTARDDALHAAAAFFAKHLA